MHLIAGPLQAVWSAISKCDGEFEIISKFPMASEISSSDAAANSSSAALFQQISRDSCALYEHAIRELLFPFIRGINGVSLRTFRSGGNREINREEQEEGSSHKSISHSETLEKKRFQLFRHDTEEIFEILKVPRSHQNSALTTAPIGVHGRLHINERSLAALSIAMTQSAPSFFDSVICLPLRNVVTHLSQSAAVTMLSSKGFNILRHIEYVKLLFLMGAETLATDVELGSSSDTPRTADSAMNPSPASIHIMLIVAFRTVFRKSVMSQYERHFSADNISSAKPPAMKSSRVGSSAVLSYDTEFYSLGQTMSIHLSQSLPKSMQLMDAGSSLLSGAGIGVSVSFRSPSVSIIATSGGSSSALGSPTQQQQADQVLKESEGRQEVYSEERCPSGYWAQQIIDSLSVELQYPFPYYKVITREYLLKLHQAMRRLMNIALMKSAVEELWKQDKVSRQSLLDAVRAHKAQEDASALLLSLERCRASRTWLLHIIKGLQYHVLSAVHENMWSAFLTSIREHGKDSVQQQRKLFEKYVDDVDQWIRLSQRETEVIIGKGHLAVSSFYTAIVAANDICMHHQAQRKVQSTDDANGSHELHMSIGIGKCIIAMKRADMEFAAVRSLMSQLISDVDDNAGAFILRQQARRTDSTFSAVSNHAKKLSTVLGGTSWRQGGGT